MGYGIAVTSFGKAPNNSDTNKELTDKKKELLRKQFRNQSKELSKNNKTIIKEDLKNESNNINDKCKEQLKISKNQIKILKAEKAILNKKLKTLEKKSEIHIKTNAKLMDSIKSINNQFLESQQKYGDVTTEYNLLQENYKNIEHKYTEYEKQMNQFNDFRKTHRELEMLSIKNKKIRLQLGSKENTIKNLIKDLDGLRINKLDSYSDMYERRIANLKNDKHSLSIENQILRKRLEVYEPTIKEEKNIIIPEVIEKEEINSKYTLVEITEFTGLLKQIDGKYYYKDYDGNIFENVNNKAFYIKDLVEVYCRVRYDKKKDMYIVKDIYPFIKSKDELIGYLYEMNLRKNNALNFYKRKAHTKKEYIDYELFNNQKVLVINSFNPNYYVAELNNYNLRVENFSTYEENPRKIIPKLKGYDIVICCTGTSRHYMNTLIENAEDYLLENESPNPKYQLMENVTLSNLLNRINYTIENLS